MSQFDKIPDKEKENTKVVGYFNDLGYYFGHFLLKSRMFEKYDIEQLKKTKEFINKLLKVCKNDPMVTTLNQMKQETDGIDVNLKFNSALLDELNELFESLTNEQKY